MPSLIDTFSDLRDPRVERTKLHNLLDIVVLTILAVICGADSWVAVEEFGHAKEAWLKTILKLENGIPSHDTIGRVFARLNPNEFGQRFSTWVAGLAKKTGQEIVSIDGKKARRSLDGALGIGAIHLVNAFATFNRLVLAQVKVDTKSNEITAIPELLRLLDLTGCIVTIDAMGTQKAIAAQIRAAQADYVLPVKENHPNLFNELSLFFDDLFATDFAEFEVDFHETTDVGHDREETRRVWCVGEVAWMSERSHWADLHSVICVERHRQIYGKPKSIERSYYISSIEDPWAEKMAEVVRGHWGIENEVHWVLDVAFREDDCRVRKGHGAENFAIIRRIAFNLLKQETSRKVGIQTKRLRAGWDPEFLLNVLTL